MGDNEKRPDNVVVSISVQDGHDLTSRKPPLRLKIIYAMLCLQTLAEAFDATSITVAIPVGLDHSIE